MNGREATVVLSRLYDRFMRGEKQKAGWVNASDFETAVSNSGPARDRTAVQQ
jgi:hypothetical protein